MLIQLNSESGHNFTVVSDGDILANMTAAVKSVMRTHSDGKKWQFNADHEGITAINVAMVRSGYLTIPIDLEIWQPHREFLGLSIIEIEG